MVKFSLSDIYLVFCWRSLQCHHVARVWGKVVFLSFQTQEHSLLFFFVCFCFLLFPGNMTSCIYSVFSAGEGTSLYSYYNASHIKNLFRGYYTLNIKPDYKSITCRYDICFRMTKIVSVNKLLWYKKNKPLQDVLWKIFSFKVITVTLLHTTPSLIIFLIKAHLSGFICSYLLMNWLLQDLYSHLHLFI